MSVFKYIRTGHILEVYEYEKFNCGKGGKRKKADDENELKKEITEMTLLNYSNHNKIRANSIRRLACANFDNRCTFLTLTFDDKLVDFDIKNVKDCNKQFKKFILRLKYFLSSRNITDDLKYLAVIEFQDENGRGAVHYHIILNVPYINHSDIASIWGLGFVKIEKINHVDNVGAYIIKYMCKDNDDVRLMGLPAYLHSRGLEEPEEIILTSENQKIDAEYYRLDTILASTPTIYETEYITDYMGKCIYKQYNLKRNDDIEYS